jgi:glutamate--cysteine ligase
MDVRDAGWKIAAVDVNLFPAGFNNLSVEDRALAAKKFREFFSARLLTTSPWRVTVVPESHTQNMGYLENLAGLLEILREAGVEPKLLWPGTPSIPKAWTLKTTSGKELVYLPPTEALENSQAMLLNHDLSGGIPSAIADVKIPTFPSPKLGWYRRRKSNHFEIVDSLLQKLEQQFPFFDSWYFSMRSSIVPEVDFESEIGLKTLVQATESIFELLKQDYLDRKIPESPRVFLKNDSGTYGLGVISLKSPGQILENIKDLRKKMRSGKGSVAVSQVILQEAIPTALRVNDTSGEPVLYMVDGRPIGGFCRVHEKLGADSRWLNLNQPGSLLEPLSCLKASSPRNFPLLRGQSICDSLGPNGLYHFLSRLHAVAAGLEDCLK